MNSRKAEAAVIPLVETPAWLCEAARSTASSMDVIRHFLEVGHYQYQYVIPVPGILILAFSLCSSAASSHQFPYTCELKIVTGLPWESFQFLMFCVVVSHSSLPSARYLIMCS